MRAYDKSKALLGRAYSVTNSPRTDLEGQFPLVLARGRGAEVGDLDGNTYLDLTASFGTVLIGHAEPVVADAVAEAAHQGNLFYTGASERRLRLAETLLRWFAWADRVLFFKTGSCAVSAAVRLAQHATRRQGVLTSGYHGWHDWHLEALPEFRLFPTYARDIADDPDVCEGYLREAPGSVAAVVVSPEPMRFRPEHYQRIGELAHAHGAKFVVDEVKTAIRAGRGGYSARAGLEPDLVTVSKGLGNGHSISAVVGLNGSMLANEHAHTWNTYQNEQTSFAAALATMEFVEEHDVPAILDRTGTVLAERVAAIIAAAGIPAAVRGWGPSFAIEALEPGNVLVQLQAALLDSGVFCDIDDDFNVCYRLSDRLNEVVRRFEDAVHVVGGDS